MKSMLSEKVEKEHAAEVALLNAAIEANLEANRRHLVRGKTQTAIQLQNYAADDLGLALQRFIAFIRYFPHGATGITPYEHKPMYSAREKDHNRRHGFSWEDPIGEP